MNETEMKRLSTAITVLQTVSSEQLETNKAMKGQLSQFIRSHSNMMQALETLFARSNAVSPIRSYKRSYLPASESVEKRP